MLWLVTPRTGSVPFTLRAAFVVAALLPPLWLMLLVIRDEQRAFRMVRRCTRAALRAAGCRVRVHDVQHMPIDGQAMLVSNHVSLADAAVLLAVLPFDFRFVANHLFAQYPLLGRAVRGVSAHIVDRGSRRSRAECGDTMVSALAAGRALLVFPEGTTADNGVMLPFRRGAFRAAARSGRPVVPIAIRGTREMLPAAVLWLSNVPIEVAVLPPLTARDATREGIADLRDRTAAAISRHLDT